MKPIKVCIYAGINPSTTFINRLIEGLADSGVEVVLHSVNKKGWQAYRSKKNIIVIGYTGKWSKLSLVCKYLPLLMAFRPKDCYILLRQLRYHTSLSGKFNFLVKAAPIVWVKPDIFHVQWVKWVDYWVWLQKLDIKVVASLRGSQINYEPRADVTLKQMYKTILPKVDGFHAVSNAIAKEATLYGATSNRIQTIYSGLRISKFPFSPVLSPSPGSTLKLLSIGRDHWVKGYTYAIDAMFLLKQRGISFHYTIIGGMSEEHLFHINEMGLSDNITLTGNISFEEVQQTLRQSHLLILPSLEEGIANVVLEAMASGIPVISTTAGGMAEVIVNSESGWLVPPQNAGAIAHMIEDYLQKRPEELSQIITNARQTIETRFHEEGMVTAMKKLYQQTIDQSF